jgi:predicted small secreted protein
MQIRRRILLRNIGANSNQQAATENQKQIMITLTKRIVVLSFVTALLALSSIGCNTAHGFGKDMEKAGEKIQEGTK